MVKRLKESWNSRLGVILAVSGSAVGLGNFLRFPGNAAQYGGGAFMLAYFIGFLLLGLPICWAEWTMGRRGGQFGFNSSPAILTILSRRRAMKFIGIIGVVIPVCIYMYYVYIEAWCLGYAVNFARGEMNFATIEESTGFWVAFIGAGADGSALHFGWTSVTGYLALCFVLNFALIYRGLSRGIELFCVYAMPALIVLAVIILVRVLTLGTPDPAYPDRTVENGLGFMWNPNKTYLEVRDDASGDWTPVTGAEILGRNQMAAARERIAAAPADYRLRTVSFLDQLLKPDLWLAAVGQIFFSLSVGFGIIVTYSSYMKREDDVVLSGLSATAANEFAEVGLGGLITLPAAVLFLGTTGLIGAGLGTFDLGFKVLPMVFASMPAGQLFGFLFFFLLFLAAVTSSLSMLQPGIAFLEESMGIGRKQSVAILGIITLLGSVFVVYFSKDAKALDTIDFWAGTFLIFILATIEIIVFSWIVGLKRGLQWAHEGAAIRIPDFFAFIMKWISPVVLLAIFAMWVLSNIFGISFRPGQPAEPSGYLKDLFYEPNPVAWMSIVLILAVGLFSLVLMNSSPRFRDLENLDTEEPS
jgi:neurotransmitter:Na+ symporter, NSS family